MIFKATRTAPEEDSLVHHGVKGQKWGVLNPETKFKYGLTSISPAAAAAGGATVDDEFMRKTREKLSKGEISLAEYNSMIMKNLVEKGKDSSSQKNSLSKEDISQLRQDLKDGKITLAQYNEKMMETNRSSSAKTAGRDYLSEALLRSKNKASEEETKEETETVKESSSKSSGKSSSGSSSKGSGGKSSGGGSKGSSGSRASKETAEKQERWVQDTIDEKPRRYQKSAFWDAINRKRAETKMTQRSVSNRNSANPKKQRVGRSLKHSDSVDSLIAVYFKEKGDRFEEEALF